MVVLRLFLVVVCLASTAALAVTADELRGASSNAEREAVQRQGRANTGDLTELLPATPKSSKYATTGGASSVKNAPVIRREKNNQGTTTNTENANIYVPPARASTSGAAQGVVTDAVQPSVAFGIRLGTWLSASLNRNTTNADSGSIELTLTADAVGDRRTLPAGSILFANKSLNGATKRLEIEVTHGITPNGQEFDVHGIGFDLQKTPGLAGLYVLDKREVASRGVTKGVLAATGAAVSTLSPGVAGAATNAATQSVLNDTNQVTDSNATQAIIYVSPQPLIIRVERQF